MRIKNTHEDYGCLGNKHDLMSPKEDKKEHKSNETIRKLWNLSMIILYIYII